MVHVVQRSSTFTIAKSLALRMDGILLGVSNIINPCAFLSATSPICMLSGMRSLFPMPSFPECSLRNDGTGKEDLTLDKI